MDSRGTGVFKDNDKSFVLVKASAEQNNDIGQFRLGFADERGSGKVKDMLTRSLGIASQRRMVINPHRMH
jgi:TPR repeat protein